MSDSQVIKSFENGLKELLKDQIALTIEFEIPKNGSDENNIIVFLLYHILENQHMKNMELQIIDDSHLKPPPMSFDLYYLIIPFGPEKKLILGKIIQFFLERPILSGADLKLKEKDEEIKIIYNPISFDDLTKIWSSFKDIGYRLSISYVVTPVRIDSTTEMDVHRVISSETLIHQK